MNKSYGGNHGKPYALQNPLFLFLLFTITFCLLSGSKLSAENRDNPGTEDPIQNARQTDSLGQLGITQKALANGIHIIVKSLADPKDPIGIYLKFGRGIQGEPQKGLALMAELAFPASGLGDGRNQEINPDAIAFHEQLSSKRNHFVLSGFSDKKNLNVLFELFCARLQHTKYSDDSKVHALDTAKQFLPYIHKNYILTYRDQIEPLLAGSKVVSVLPSFEEFAELKMDALQEWLNAQLLQAPMTLVIVGDVAPDEIIKLCEQTFGKLPLNPARPPSESKEITGAFPKAFSKTIALDIQNRDSVFFFQWPVHTYETPEQIVYHWFLHSLINVYCGPRVLEQLGQDSSFFYQFNPLEGSDVPGYSSVQVTSFSGREERFSAAIQHSIYSFKDKTLSDQELKNLKETFLQDSILRANDPQYWANGLLQELPNRDLWLQANIVSNDVLSNLDGDLLMQMLQKTINPETEVLLILKPNIDMPRIKRPIPAPRESVLK